MESSTVFTPNSTDTVAVHDDEKIYSCICPGPVKNVAWILCSRELNSDAESFL